MLMPNIFVCETGYWRETGLFWNPGLWRVQPQRAVRVREPQLPELLRGQPWEAGTALVHGCVDSRTCGEMLLHVLFLSRPP